MSISVRTPRPPLFSKDRRTFCGNDGNCKRLERGCDIVRANRKGLMDVETEPKTAVKGIRNEVSFPFLMGTRKLSKPFQVGGGKCGLSASARNT